MKSQQIKELVEARSGIADISVRGSQTHLANARTIYARICCDFVLMNSTLSKIGEVIDRDHSNILHLNTKAFDKRKKLTAFKTLYAEVLVDVNKLKDIEDKRRESDFDPIAFLAESEDYQIEKITKLRNELEREILEQRKEIAKMKLAAKLPIIAEIMQLESDELETFSFRASVMIKSIKSQRTYENTNRSDFNAA